jgi:hypothetical protein
MTLFVTKGRKSSLGGLHQKAAEQRCYCSGTEGNHENLDGVGRSQDLLGCTLTASLKSSVETHEP